MTKGEKLFFTRYVCARCLRKVKFFRARFPQKGCYPICRRKRSLRRNAGGFPGEELLGLKMAQVHVLPNSKERIQNKTKHPLKKKLIKKRNWSQISRPIQHIKSQN